MMSVFCLPQRRNASGQMLSFIPPEVYMTIFDELQPTPADGPFNETHYKGTLARLTLVCHHFRDLCQGRMFKHLRFYGFAAMDPETTSKQIVGRRNWREALAARDPSCVALSNCVKLVTLSHWMSSSNIWPRDQEYYTQPLQTNIDALVSLRSLQAVQLDNCVLENAVLDGLARIPQLVSVELTDCIISSSYPPTDYSVFDRKGWTTLRVIGQRPRADRINAGDAALFSRQLARLVDHNKLQHLSADHRTVPLLEIFLDESGVSVTELQFLQILGMKSFLPSTLALLVKHVPKARRLRTFQVAPMHPQEHLLISVRILGPMRSKHLSCTVAAGITTGEAEVRLLERPRTVAELQTLFELWTPLLPVDLSFSFPSLDSRELGTVVVRIVQQIFKLFERCKRGALDEDVYKNAGVLRIEVDFGSPWKTHGETTQPTSANYQQVLNGVDFSELFNQKLDTIFPSLDYISVTGLVRPCELHRDRTRCSDPVWRSL